MGDDRQGPRVTVATSTRMADPDRPEDVMHGKRFTDPRTGAPVSIVDILGSLGIGEPPPSPGPEAEEGRPGPSRDA